MAVDLKKYPRAACSKHNGEKPHTAGKVSSSTHCIDCGKTLVKKKDPERWEIHAAED